MLKNLVQLEHKVGDSVFHFYCAADANLEHIKIALVKFMGYVSNVEAAVEAQKASLDKSAPVEEPKAEVSETPEV